MNGNKGYELESEANFFIVSTLLSGVMTTCHMSSTCEVYLSGKADYVRWKGQQHTANKSFEIQRMMTTTRHSR